MKKPFIFNLLSCFKMPRTKALEFQTAILQPNFKTDTKQKQKISEIHVS